MSQSQSIKVTYPKLHGNGPRNLSMLINLPITPMNNGKAKSFKEVYSLVKAGRNGNKR